MENNLSEYSKRMEIQIIFFRCKYLEPKINNLSVLLIMY